MTKKEMSKLEIREKEMKYKWLLNVKKNPINCSKNSKRSTVISMMFQSCAYGPGWCLPICTTALKSLPMSQHLVVATRNSELLFRKLLVGPTHKSAQNLGVDKSTVTRIMHLQSLQLLLEKHWLVLLKCWHLHTLVIEKPIQEEWILLEVNISTTYVSVNFCTPVVSPTGGYAWLYCLFEIHYWMFQNMKQKC